MKATITSVPDRIMRRARSAGRGGVFTPPDLRGLGFARACVAGSLVAARTAGVGRSVLFTPKENASAQAAYRAIGFRIVGEYGLVAFA